MTQTDKMDFSVPRRLDDGGFLIIGLLSFGRILRAAWLPLIIFIFRSPQLFLQWKFWAISGTVLLLIFIIAAIRHRYYRYYIDEPTSAFILEKGIFSKTKIIVKFHNIQNINIKQNVVQQALDLYSIEIESAGSSGKEVDLYALDETTALELKQYLASKSLGHHLSSDSDETVLAISRKNILLVSLLSNYAQGLGLFLAFVIGLFDTFREFVSFEDINNLYEGAEGNWSAALFEIFIIGLVILLIPLSINLFKYFISYYNFSVRRNAQGNLIMHFGLFHIQDIILNKQKVQHFSYSYNYLLNRLGIGILSLYQINTDAAKSGMAAVLMPGINQEGKQKIWEILLGQDGSGERSEYRPEPGLFVSRMIKALLITSLVTGLAYLAGAGTLIYQGIGLFFLFMVIFNYFYWRKYRLFVAERHLIKRDGFWDMKDQIIPVDRIISIEVSQTFFQRRLGTATLEVTTPAGRISLSFFKKNLIVDLSNQLLYRITQK